MNIRNAKKLLAIAISDRLFVSEMAEKARELFGLGLQSTGIKPQRYPRDRNLGFSFTPKFSFLRKCESLGAVYLILPYLSYYVKD